MAVSIGILGLGRIGSIHAESVHANSKAELVAVAEADTELARIAAKRFDAKIMSIEDILADKKIDAVIIATPTDTHADLVEKSARAGKAIFCEKPVDLDAGRVRSCLKVVRETGARLFVGFNRRFDPSFMELKARLKAIAPIELVHITSRDPGPPPIPYVKRSGGIFRDMTIHDFDMARWLIGEDFVEIHAMAANHVDPEIGIAGDFDTAIVNLRTESGILCHISNSRRAVYGYDQRIEIHGAEGMLRADNWHSNTVEFADRKGYIRPPLLNFFLERYAQAYRNELDAFIASLESHQEEFPNGEDGLKALLLADAALQSVQTDKPVSLRF